MLSGTKKGAADTGITWFVFVFIKEAAALNVYNVKVSRVDTDWYLSVNV